MKKAFILLIPFLCSFTSFQFKSEPTRQEYYSRSIDSRVIKAVFDVMNYYSFDEELLIAVIWRESKFKVNVVGKNNDKTMDYGLCQLNSKYHNLKPKDLLKIKTNVELGAKHLDWCIKKSKGNLERALNFYHCGYGNVMNRGWHNNEYVKDITNYANMLRLSYFNYRSNN